MQAYRYALLRLCGLCGVLLLSACSAPKSLYQWEGYQPQVYEYFKGDGKNHEEQVAALEQGLQKIRGSGNVVPPGYHAHLGLLYAKVGKDDQLQQQLETEKTNFPESSGFMDFLLKKLGK